ncbi:MAG: hypothetical protein H0T59_06385, partial [Chloroflexi bacterium]|nr:hypothetical protein [Chloroflexota bacterium]
ASVIIYMGHGNGWPSPYTYDPEYTTKDGFGLNATYGNGDYNNKYYGEPYVSTLDLAPGAIILLHHLCYAAGNSEPGDAEPSVSVARKRADNYAAGFLKAGAAAVIADGHSGADPYLRALFTTHQSIEDMWRTMPNKNGNVVSFASTRTPGATVYQDPKTPTSGFYRALTIGSLGVTTDEVVAGGYGDTSLDPSGLVVPGNASVAASGAALYGAPDATASVNATLPVGTRLRAVSQPGGTSAEGTPFVEIRGIDDPSISGYVLATDLVARDSTAPAVRGLDAGGPISPNGDGQGDAATISGRFTETVAWTLQVKGSGGGVKFEATGSGPMFETTWNGKSGGNPVADGSYQVELTGVDSWANPAARATRTLVVDTVAPTLTSLTPGTEETRWFSPNGDGVRDTIDVTATSTESGTLIARVLDAGGSLVKKWSTSTGTSATTVTWDGRNTDGASVTDGVYRIRVVPQDVAGNTGANVERSATVIRALKSVVASKSIFYPHDGDRLAKSSTLSFSLVRPMTVTWTLRNAAGATVLTRLDAVALPTGTSTWSFTGRDSAGALLPRGRYTSVVSATDGTLTATQTTTIDMNAFWIKTSDSTPARGQSITLNVTSAEKLAARPKVFIYQPGLSRWKVRMVKTGTNTYKVTFKLKSGGSKGQVTFKVKGRDIDDGKQSTLAVYAIH